ncbi:hypothetical protein HYPSUDRAFT_42931 [Hypholoma sublateritium FD-334 SS-4]|uniref:RNA exonuclease 4 n=1 Tax=Hypholoma sublateritium (strain FD-334 SS-4) TaxID=945553 RepID=A0A0D2MB57_HYPSF|nr:hypothetical protein HYPSUDRAFT_42931 [Hypholoma sublateritium FD-334 SS-4]
MPPSKGKNVPSGNWLALQKQLDSQKKKNSDSQHGRDEGSRKRRKVEREEPNKRFSTHTITSEQGLAPTAGPSAPHAPTSMTWKNGESVDLLQQMALGNVEYTPQQELPGKFLALDCEMVGVGIDGAESSLARVSLVNFYGAVILDEFVRQKERVVDYRTQWSGIRESDMIHAHKFEDVQKRVAQLLQDRILVGHAVHNDLKALLLSHPRAQTRDTQIYAHKFAVTKSKRVALRNLVKDELGLTIQGGEHSSITDARATMAVYRLHKKEWEKGSRPLPPPSAKSAAVTAATKRKEMDKSDSDVSDSEGDDSPEPVVAPKLNGKGKGKDAPTEYPGGGRKGVSSGLSTVVRRGVAGSRTAVEGKGGSAGGATSSAKNEWWKQLPGGAPVGGSKGSIRIAMKDSLL